MLRGTSAANAARKMAAPARDGGADKKPLSTGHVVLGEQLPTLRWLVLAAMLPNGRSSVEMGGGTALRGVSKEAQSRRERRGRKSNKRQGGQESFTAGPSARYNGPMVAFHVPVN